MQNSIMFCLFILKFTSKVDAYYKKNQYFFSLYTNFEIFQKFSVKIKIFLHILIVLIMYESGKVKKIQSNKIGITIYSWTVWGLWLFQGLRLFQSLEYLFDSLEYVLMYLHTYLKEVVQLRVRLLVPCDLKIPSNSNFYLRILLKWNARTENGK